MVSNRSHRFYSCLSFASVKVGGREICKMFSFFVFFYQQIAKPKDMALKLLRCVRWTCEIQIAPDDTVNGLNPGVTCSTVV